MKLSGHHVEITPSLRSYVEKRFERLSRHFDNVIDVHCVLTVEKAGHKAEATLHMRGETVHAMGEAEIMYAAIDALADKLDRLVVRHKEKAKDHHAAEARKGARA
jgi:putative sigma-54 modulation protein